jgi:hypothetical protein
MIRLPLEKSNQKNPVWNLNTELIKHIPDIRQNPVIMIIGDEIDIPY